MSFQTEIEAITGSISSYTSQANLYLVEGVKFISKYVMSNPEMAERMTTSGTAMTNNNGLNLASVLKVVSVVRYDGTRDREALEVPVVKAPDYLDSNSIYYTSKYDPKYYITNGTLKVIPIPTSSEESKVRRIDPDTTVAVGDVSIDNFPDELERGVVLYASKEMLRKFMSTKNSGLPADMTIPTLPSAPSIGILTIDALGTAPTYTQTVLNLTNTPNISALTIGASAPSSITLGTVAYIDAILGDASSSGESIGATTIPSIADADVTTNVPLYSKTNLTLTTAPSISALSISVSAPTEPSISVITYDDATNADASASTVGSVNKATITNNLPTYIQPTISLTAAPSISDLSISASAPTAPTLSNTIIGNLGTAPTYNQVSLSIDYTQLGSNSDDYGLDDFVINEDVELAQTVLGKHAQQIQKYQSDIQNNLNEFNKDVIAYQTDLQRKIEQAKIETGEDSQALQKYQSETQVYSANVGKEVQQYQANLEKELQLWSTKRNTELSQYQTDIQNNLNAFNEQNTKYQADVQAELAEHQTDLQKALTDAQTATQVSLANKQQDQVLALQNAASNMEAAVQDNNQTMQDYQAKVQAYQAQVSEQVQEYSSNLERELQLFSVKRNTEISKYQADMQNELNEFNKDNVRYQAEIQEELTKHNTALQKALAQAQIDSADAQQESKFAASRNLANQQKDLQIKLEAATKEMEAIIAQNSSKVADYNARISLYQAQVNDEVQEYTKNLERELQLFSVQRNTEIQKHQNDMQDELNTFNKELQIYQTDLSHKIKQADLTSQEEGLNLQKYSGELGAYGQELNKEVQNFTTKLQKLTADYKWLQDQYQLVSRDLIMFLQIYLPAPRMKEAKDEIAADDRRG